MFFQSELNKFAYRQQVYHILTNWSVTSLSRYISGLTPDQLQDDVPPQLIINTSDHTKLVEYLCIQIWGWGWEGCDWFINNHHNGVDWMIEHCND